MAKYNINIEIDARYNQAFGFAFKNISAQAGIGYNGNSIYANIKTFEPAGDFDIIKIKGTGFTLKFGDMPFYSGNYGIFENLKGKSGSSGSSVFAPPPMIRFQRSKNKKVTLMDGSDNEVVESFGLKSWDIKMQGIVVDMEQHGYPSEQVKKLVTLFNANEILEVSGIMFEEKGIRSIHIDNIEISGVEGFADTQKYNISAKSIKPVEFSILENK